MKVEFTYFKGDEKQRALELCNFFGKEYQYYSINVSFTDNYKIGIKSLEDGKTPKKLIQVYSDGTDYRDGLSQNTKFAICVADALGSQIVMHHNEDMIHITAAEAKQAIKDNAINQLALDVMRKHYELDAPVVR